MSKNFQKSAKNRKRVNNGGKIEANGKKYKKPEKHYFVVTKILNTYLLYEKSNLN